MGIKTYLVTIEEAEKIADAEGYELIGWIDEPTIDVVEAMIDKANSAVH